MSASNPIAPFEDRYLNAREASAFIGVKLSTLARWRQRGVGPKYSAALRRDPRYRLRDLVEWLESQTAQNTVEARHVRLKAKRDQGNA